MHRGGVTPLASQNRLLHDGSGRAPTTRPKPRKSTSGDKIEEADSDICRELEPPEILRATSTLSCHCALHHYYALKTVADPYITVFLIVPVPSASEAVAVLLGAEVMAGSSAYPGPLARPPVD